MIDGRSLLVVTGKGGVGKTTVTAALALALAREGRRPLVVEVSGKDDVARLLGGPGTHGAYAERAIADRVRHLSIDPDHALREYLDAHLPFGGLLEHTRLARLLFAATPGLGELLTIGKVWELARGAGRDCVLLDAPATGHAIALLTAPRTFAAAARGGPVAEQAAGIRRFLGDRRRTGVLAVSTAEELPVNETLQLRGALDAAGVALAGVFVNAVYPRRFTARQVDVLAAAPATAASRAGRFHATRARQHAAGVRRLRGAVGSVTAVRTLPYVFDADDVARDLAGRVTR
jgi:anion-transporting  ArsA/GET3 family ATPase